MTLAVDPLSSVLRSIRARGHLVLNDSYAVPWAVDVPRGEALAAIIDQDPDDRMVAFHYVQRGSLDKRVRGVQPVH